MKPNSTYNTMLPFIGKTLSLLLLLLPQLVWAQVDEDLIKKYMDEKKPKKALEYVNKDIEKNGMNEDNMTWKSEVLLFVNGDQCWENLQLTIQKFPNSAKAYNQRALFYFELKQMNNSINDFNKALELCKDDSFRFTLLINRSGPLHYMGNLDQSIADCKEALKLRPNNIDALNNLSTVLFENKQYEEAENILLQMRAIDTTYLGVYVNLGYQLQTRGDYKKAEMYLLQGLAQYPNDGYVLNNLGYAQYKLGKNDEALKNINKSLKVFPDNAYAYRNLALIYLDLKEKDKACEYIQKSLQLKFSEMYGPEMKELKEKNCL